MGLGRKGATSKALQAPNMMRSLSLSLVAPFRPYLTKLVRVIQKRILHAYVTSCLG